MKGSVGTTQPRWIRERESCEKHLRFSCSLQSQPFAFFYLLTPRLSYLLCLWLLLRKTPAAPPTCQEMTDIKYDTQSLCHHCHECHFPQEWNWRRRRIVTALFLGQTFLMQHLSHSTSTAFPLALLSEKKTTTNHRFSWCRNTLEDD